MTIASKSRPAILKVIEQLHAHFKLRHLGPTTGLLRVCVTCDRALCKQRIDQQAFAVDVLSWFNMLTSKPVTTPLDQYMHLSKAHCPQTAAEVKEMQQYPYIQATGALLYLTMCTRPNIAHTVSVLCRFNSCPGKAHWGAVKHLLHYVQGTLDYAIEYSADPASPTISPSLFIAFTDADHGGNVDNGRSTTGTLLTVAGGAVSWTLHLQSIVALSTTEAEFVATSETGRELCWLRNFLADIGIPQVSPSTMNVDNQSAISVSKHPEHMGRLKHLDCHWFWLHQALYDSKIAPIYIASEDMAVDLLTKALLREGVDRLRRMMGIIGEFSKADIG